MNSLLRPFPHLLEHSARFVQHAPEEFPRAKHKTGMRVKLILTESFRDYSSKGSDE
jgi:hypothetical protein